jgi:hypothetical protein
MDAPPYKSASMCQSGDVSSTTSKEGASVMNITTIGLDLAKSVFQVHGVDETGRAVLKKQLTRR